jgi:hypothetical protein
MTIRNLIVASVIALGATAAHADNNWAFDDAYWKQQETIQSVQSIQSAQAGEATGRYDLVDRYNP